MKWPRLTRRSLFGRSALAILGFMLLFQIIAYSITVKLIVWPLIRSSTDDLAALILLTTRTLAAAPPAQVNILLAQLGASHHLNLTIAHGPMPGAPTALPFAAMLQDALTQRLGQPVQVMKNGDEYAVDVPAAGRLIRFDFPHSRIGTDPYLAMLLILAVTLLLSFTASVVVAYKLTRHLLELGRTAARVGQGHALQLDVEAGVEELDELVHSFNHMAQQIHALIQNHTTLLAGISHDLRSPLTRAKLALELAEATPDAATFNDLNRYLEQMENLIAEFLDFSRGVAADAGAPLELSALVSQTCEELSASGSNVHFSGENGYARCNRSGLSRVLRNLIENAQRYSNGPVEVCLSMRPHSALIEVHDCGPGIPEAERERVFLPFVRLEASRNPISGGSGLGLAIVKEICRVHHWKIELATRTQGGLTASLAIPLTPASLDA